MCQASEWQKLLQRSKGWAAFAELRTYTTAVSAVLCWKWCFTAMPQHDKLCW
jgi:hypothetical protein